jgi:FimV-like protein
VNAPALPRRLRLRHSTLAVAAALLALGAPAGANTNAAAPAGYTTRDQDNLWNLGATHAAASRHSRQQWMVATLRRNPDAFLQGNIHRLRSQATLQFPSDAEVAAEDQSAAEALLLRHLAGVLTNETFAALPPRTPPAAVPAAPAASAPLPPAPAAPAPAPAAPAPAASAPAVPAPAPDTPPRALPGPPAGTPPQASVPAGEAPGSWWPFGLAIVLASGAVALLFRSRRTGKPFAETVSTLFQDTLQLVRPSKPKVVNVSSAAADMARSVEQLASTDRLVQPDDGSASSPADSHASEAALRLATARAQIELGRRDAAVAVLRGLVRDLSDGAERRAAEQLLGQLGVA